MYDENSFTSYFRATIIKKPLYKIFCIILDDIPQLLFEISFTFIYFDIIFFKLCYFFFHRIINCDQHTNDGNH